MANELELRSVDLQRMISSPECVSLRRISLGTLNQDGGPPVRYLSGGLTLTDELRGRIERKLGELKPFVVAETSPEVRRTHLALITKMLVTYPLPGASSETGKARSEAYCYVVEDIPPWVLNDAIRAWHRGECGSEYNYRWAPAPAELRQICLDRIQSGRDTISHLEAVLAAPTLEEAMNAEKSPLTIVPKPQKMNTAAASRQSN